MRSIGNFKVVMFIHFLTIGKSNKNQIYKNSRLAKQEEMGNTMKNQNPLMPSVTSPTTAKSRPKDLTETLLANNLNQLNWSTNKTSLPGTTTTTTPNYMPSSNFSPSANSPQQTFGNRMQSSTMSWNQTVPQNYNASASPMQLSGSSMGWTSPSMMLPSNSMMMNSNSQGQSAPKLSSEEIMDFLK